MSTWQSKEENIRQNKEKNKITKFLAHVHKLKTNIVECKNWKSDVGKVLTDYHI